MVAPIIYAAGSALSTYFTTKAAEETKAEKKLELLSKLADLTPEQARAVDAVRRESVGDLEERVRMGIGPFQPLTKDVRKQAKEVEKAAKKEAKALEKHIKSLPPAEKQAAIRGIARGIAARVSRAEEADLSRNPVTITEVVNRGLAGRFLVRTGRRMF